jgi:vacuolar-type H+-ATPase subunit H
MTITEEEKEQFIKQAKQNALTDVESLEKSMAELTDRIFHFAYEAGYQQGFQDGSSGDLISDPAS